MIGMKKILFVCVHNAGRSQIAEAFFNQLAKGKAIAFSAGTKPASQINPVVIQAMNETGLDISKNKPQLLTMEMMENTFRVITMGCGAEDACPAALVPMEDWGIEDPAGQSIEKVREIRDIIKKKVLHLINTLSANDSSTIKGRE